MTGPARDPGFALDERTGRDAASDDLERDHLRAPHEHLVVVVVLAAVRVVVGNPHRLSSRKTRAVVLAARRPLPSIVLRRAPSPAVMLSPCVTTSTSGCPGYS